MSRAMATATPNKFLLEPFTGSKDFANYLMHFELLAQLRKWRRPEPREGIEVEII